MEELDVIDLPDGRRGTVVHVSSDHAMIIVEAGSELIDYEVSENRLKEISRVTVGPEDLSNRLVDGRKVAD
ncbi:hypothetical protein [Microvirga yunnanensis]|uniref:hypothetical protein n=1 Tax=Microvirga yunnanensis TaxID=2953740 RepID=UPI0021C6E6F0|nr:hypothetical protein [Microvirga sp. HBU65207]